ncbi:MAG: hypothetical protein PWP26_503, partial [Thermodesulfobacterium sp.]|nr:hypothetical protein [Thermodesulfobacterium sp.]
FEVGQVSTNYMKAVVDLVGVMCRNPF